MKSCLLKIIFAGSIGLLSSLAAFAQHTKKQIENSTTKTSASSMTADNLLPRKIDDRTAVSPVYSTNSKNCRNRDSQMSEGDDFYRECKAWGDYILRVSGSDYRINYGIRAKNANNNSLVMFFPLETGLAANYARADLYDEKLADEIEWRLNDQGKPFAVIVRAAFYKNIGSAKTFANPKNKRAEFYLVRGLAGFENLKEDVPTTGTAFNPLEQARAIAAEYYESHH